ncbi:hypothetical protein F4801DRAFT_540833 [Xylaria longipes]|nr:hypothetical protein F4801DRAFT_540833 [Xylaria longipes]
MSILVEIVLVSNVLHVVIGSCWLSFHRAGGLFQCKSHVKLPIDVRKSPPEISARRWVLRLFPAMSYTDEDKERLGTACR